MIITDLMISSLLLQDYSYLLEDQALLLSSLDKLKRLAGKQKVSEWSELVAAGRHEALVRDLVSEYYDKCYRAPRGDPLRTLHVPEGLVTEPATLAASSLVADIRTLGSDYMQSKSEASSP